MTTEDLRVIKSRRAIEQAFVTLVATEGFAHVTVKGLCAEALVGRSTFYRYYQDKYDLLEQLVAHYVGLFDRLLTRRLAAARLDTLLTTLYQELAVHRQSLLVLLTLHEPTGDLRQALTGVLETQLTAYLQRFTLPVPSDFLAQLYAANVLTALTWSLEHGVTPAVTDFMNRLFNTVSRQYGD